MSPQLSSLERAELLFSQGDYVAAAMEYRKVVECPADEWQREEARIGAAKSLVELKKFPAAIVALGPLPTAPASSIDARKLAVAGEVYLRENRTKEAESCLELALDACPLEMLLARCTKNGNPQGADAVIAASFDASPEAQPKSQATEIIPPGTPIRNPSSPKPTTAVDALSPSLDPRGAPMMANAAMVPHWLPGCCANLGYAYLRNDKPEKAAVLYDFAAHLFRLRGDRIAAERAQRLSDDLCAVLRQYAPFKPAPLGQYLPPGKKWATMK